MSADDDRLTRKLARFIRVGRVKALNPEKHMVRVLFEAEDSLSYELPVLVHNTFANHDYAMPDLEDDVVCVFLPDGPEDGFVIGSFYAGEVTPPANSEDLRRVQFQDGTTVTYNRASHDLDVVIEGTHIHANRQSVDVTTPISVNVNTNGNISLNASGNIAIQAGGAVTINGASVSIN